MSTCRVGYDLHNKYGRRSFLTIIKQSKGKALFRRWLWDYILKDTIGHHICAIIGHSNKMFWNFDCKGDRYCLCNRCYKRINIECGNLDIFDKGEDFMRSHHYNGREWKCNNPKLCIKKRVAMEL